MNKHQPLSASHQVWTKICGIKQPADLPWLIELMPDALGFNFYEKSIRYVSPASAREMIAQLPPAILPIGLFVNHSPDYIREICELTGITTIQLHGNESPALMQQLSDYRIIRAVRLSPDLGLSELLTEHHLLTNANIIPAAYLIDKRSSSAYGGTGETVSWELLAREYDKQSFPPLILAGGLKSHNIQQAVQTVLPFGIDVASGVESPPGVKNQQLCQQLLLNIRSL